MFERSKLEVSTCIPESEYAMDLKALHMPTSECKMLRNNLRTLADPKSAVIVAFTKQEYPKLRKGFGLSSIEVRAFTTCCAPPSPPREEELEPLWQQLTCVVWISDLKIIRHNNTAELHTDTTYRNHSGGTLVSNTTEPHTETTYRNPSHRTLLSNAQEPPTETFRTEHYWVTQNHHL